MGKKFLIGFMSLFLLSLLVLGGTFFWLLSHPASVQSWVQQQTGLTLKAETVELTSYFPVLHLNARTVAIQSPQALPLATIEKLSLGFNLLHLLLGKITFETVVLQQFHAEIGFSEQGDFRLGNWQLPARSNELGIWSGFRLQVNHWLVSQGELDLNLPTRWQMPHMQFSHIFAQGKLQEGEMRVQARLDWGGKVAEFAGEFEKIQAHWQGHYQMSQIPLHHFTLPEAPQAFPAMDLEGILNLAGTVQESTGQWTSQAAWEVHQGKIKNPYFPAGQMPLLAFAGNLHLVFDPAQGANLKIDLAQAQIPPGNLQGHVRFEFPPEGAPLMEVDVAATDWPVNASKPYILGFMPALASEWIETHLHDGVLPQAHFELRWEMDFQYADVNEVLHLNLQTELAAVRVEPFEKIPAVTDLHGHLHLGLWGLSVEIDQGRFPGTRLAGGILSIEYGAPVRTPFQLEVYGQTETPQTWPLIVSLWGKEVPWLHQVSLQGPAAVKFLLEDENLLDKTPFSLEFQVLPQQVGIQWKTPAQTYRVEAVEGRFMANLHGLHWENLTFAHGALTGKSAGRFSFEDPAPLQAEIHLESLEKLLPVYSAGHTAPPWQPKSLVADLKLRQSFREGLPLLWHLDVMTTDDQQQNLSIQAEWQNTQWKLPKITGKLGPFQLEGFLNLPAQEVALHVESQVPKTFNFELKGSQAAATVRVRASELVVQDWLHWKLPQDLVSLLPGHGSQGAGFAIPFQKLQGTLTVDDFYLPGNPATRLEAELRFEESSAGKNIFVEKFVLGNQRGQAHVQWAADQLNFAIAGARLDVQPWLKMFQFPAVQTLLEKAPSGRGFAEIHAALKTKNLHWSEGVSPQVALRSTIQLAGHEGRDSPKIFAWVDEFVLDEQKAQAQVGYQDEKLAVQIQGTRLEPHFWRNFFQKTQASWKTSGQSALSGLQQIQLDLQVAEFYFSPAFSPQIALQTSIQLPHPAQNRPLSWTMQIEKFALGKQRLQANVRYEKAILALQLQGREVQLESWLDFMDTNPLATSPQAPTLEGLQQIQLEAHFETMWAFEKEISPVSLQSTLHFPANGATPFFKWEVQNFESSTSFVIPAKPDVLPPMPFSAHFQVSGAGRFHMPTAGSAGQVEGQLQWKMREGRLHNEAFPQQHMQVQMAGGVELNIRALQAPSIRLHLTEAHMPFGTLVGEAELVFSPQKSPSLALHLVAGNWSIEKAKPYLEGVLPAEASDWIRGHIFGGQVEGAELTFQGALGADFSSGATIETFDLNAALTEIDLHLLGNEVLIENVAADLNWGQWGGRLQLKQAQEELALLVPDSGANPLELSPKNEEATYQIEGLQGTIWMTDAALRWESLRFKSGWIEVQSEGQFPFGQEAPKMLFRLNHLEKLLPVHEAAKPQSAPHPFAQWLPKKLSAQVELEQSTHTAQGVQWQAHAVTTDEHGQHLEVAVAWQGADWEIQKIQGKLGRLTTTSTRPQTNVLDVTILPFQHDPIHVQFHKEGRQSRLALQTPTLRWQDWIGWRMAQPLKDLVAVAQSNFSPEPLALEVSLNIAALQLPHNTRVPFQTKFLFQEKPQGFVLVLHELIVAEQKTEGALSFFQDQIHLQIRSERLQMQSWWNLLQGWKGEPAEDWAHPLAIAALHLDFETQHLDFSETFQPPLSLQMSLLFPKYPEQAPTLKVHRFALFGTEGRGTVVLDRHAQVDLLLEKTNLPQFLQNAHNLSAISWLQTGGQKGAGNFLERLDFLLEIPEHRFHLSGRADWDASNIQIDFQQFQWERQTGHLLWEQTDTDVKIVGNFPYVDLEKWSSVRSEIQKMLEEAEKAHFPKPFPPEEEFTFALPTKKWQVDLTVEEIKLLKTTLHEFVFQGEWGQEAILIPKFVWKQNAQPAFSLAGNLQPHAGATPVWQGDFSVEISDLGEVIELLFGSRSAVAREYPITGGQSQLQAEVQLVPAGAGRWKPQAALVFQSREGIVEQGASLTFLLATFSLQSYFKAAQGKLSGFEGRGFVYNTIQSDMALDGGRLEVKNFVFASPAMRFVASGVLDYATEQQDLLICLQPFETVDKILRNIPLLNGLLTSQRGSFLEGCYKSSGSIEEPSLIPLPQTLLPGRLRDLFISGFSGLFHKE